MDDVRGILSYMSCYFMDANAKVPSIALMQS